MTATDALRHTDPWAAHGPIIALDDVTIRYPEHDAPTLTEVDLRIDEGEFVLVVGRTGSGKSTLLGLLNGLVPHFTGGTLAGSVVVAGRDTATHRPKDLADVVAFVVQDPASSFVTDTVEEEIAFGMEAIGLPEHVMRRRVEETLDLLSLAPLRRRGVRTLSGGEQQRVAIAAVLAAGPRILVLDEPTSSLDPVAAEDVLSALARLVHDLGLTVILAEHRLERVIHHADSIVIVEDGRVRGPLPTAVGLTDAPVHPPLTALARRLGLHPTPTSVRQARRAVSRGMVPTPLPAPPASAAPSATGPVGSTAPQAVVEVSRLYVTRAGRVVLDGIDLRLHAGTTTALMGRNGVGKSTLLDTLCGSRTPTGGRVRVGGADPARLRAGQRVRQVGLVPQEASSLLLAASVATECADADADLGAPPGRCAELFDELSGGAFAELAREHPRDLSEGQRLLLALAVILSGDPAVVLLDEPTRGLDYTAKDRLLDVLRRLAGHGRAVLVATHDVEFAAELDRVVVLADGDVIADGSSFDVLTTSTTFAPQVTKVFAPTPVLRLDQVPAR